MIAFSLPIVLILLFLLGLWCLFRAFDRDDADEYFDNPKYNEPTLWQRFKALFKESDDDDIDEGRVW